MKIIDFSVLGIYNSLDVLKKIERDRDKLKKALINQEKNSLNDSILNLYNYGYHIKEWLKKENYAGVEDYINNNIELKICADLCNGSKHKILTSIRSKEDQVEKINPSEITIDSTAYTTDSLISINSLTFEIELESGKRFEVLYFANKIIELWTKFISENKR